MMVIIWLAFLLGIAAAQKAQCEDDAGNVHEDGDKWTDEDLSCRNYRCVDGKIRRGFTACKWKGSCYEPFSRWKDGCHQYTCVMTFDKVTYHVHVRAGNNCIIDESVVTLVECSHNGTCWKDGDRWEINCHTYSCKVTTQEDGTKLATSGPIKVGCKVDNKCRKAGDAWKKGCFRYTCVDYIDNSVRSSRVDVVPSCVHKGKCVPVGDTVDMGCSTFKCTVSGDNVLKLEPQSIGCRYRNDCIPHGKTVTVKCVTYQCGFQSNGQLRMTPNTHGDIMTGATCGAGDAHSSGIPDLAFGFCEGCLHEGKCYQDGKEWSDPTVCATYKCTSKQRRFRTKMNVRVSKHGCPWEKTCKKNNERWVDNDCAEHVCVIRKRKFRSTHTDKVTRQLCVDNYGRCVEWGAKGFSAVVKGVKFNDCSCEKKGMRSSLTNCQ